LKGRFGQAEEASVLLIEAKDAAYACGELNYEAELFGLEGQLILRAGKATSQSESKAVQARAEECFVHALEISRRCGSKSQELQAAMNLARLWRQQGKIEEARQALTDVYRWFTEGFETADLRRAKTLLAELS
jgi:predicted ATPase